MSGNRARLRDLRLGRDGIDNSLVVYHGEPLSYRRSASGFAVDFLLGDHTAVEVKAGARVSPHDLRSLRALGEEQVFKRLLCVSLESRTRKVGEVTVLPLARFLEQLWGGAFV